MAKHHLVPILLSLELLVTGIGFAQTPAGPVTGAPAQKITPGVHSSSPPAKPARPHTKPGPQAATTQKPAAAPASKVAAAAPAKPVHPPVVEPAKPEPPKETPKVGSVTGLPLPRFAALRSDDVNLRVGPGTRYPISWVYKRRELPVQIEREYEVWRLVQDPDGNLGWVHQANLVGRRTFVLRGETRPMRRSADDNSPAVAVLKPGVVGRVLSCAAESPWCEVQVSEYRGYLRRETFWGTFAGEAVN